MKGQENSTTIVTTRIDRSAAFWQLVRTSTPPDLGQRPRAGTMTRASLMAGLEHLQTQYAWDVWQSERLTALALLYHDHYNEAHDIVQDHMDPEGAAIHAIVHRREPDYWNAKYWFRRVGNHPVYHKLTHQLPTLADRIEVAEWSARLTLAGWMDPLAMVDRCEELASQADDHPEVVWLRQVQRAEFEALVSHLLEVGSGFRSP